MVIEEEKDSKPLFSFRGFTKDGSDLPSAEVNQLDKSQFFVIDGQQRLQSFYIGLVGTMKGKHLYFDLFSNYDNLYEFKFSISVEDRKALPLKAPPSETEGRIVPEHCWFPVRTLLEELKMTNNDRSVAKKIIRSLDITDEKQVDLIEANVATFYRNVIGGETLGLSLVSIDKTRDEVENRQRIVELFRRLNDGGTRLAGFDLVASILKGFDWNMESFIDGMFAEFSDIGVNQDSLVKTIFILQDNHTSEMANISSGDATFAVNNRKRIRSCFVALRKFMRYTGLYNYYNGNFNRSFIPLYFILHHLFHQKQLDDAAIEKYFDNHEVNDNYKQIKKWLLLSLLNGVFKGRGSGWIPYKTGIRKLLEVLKNHKDKDFPCDSIFMMYHDHPLTFNESVTGDTLNGFDREFLYYLIYDKAPSIRQQDEDHIIPKSHLEKKYSPDEINNIRNFELLDSGTNRGNKNATEYKKWVETSVANKEEYLRRHLIPADETLWTVENYLTFLKAREKLILAKIHENGV